MRVIVIRYGDHHCAAELIGDTDKAMVLPVRSFKRPKYMRRYVRKQFGAGSLVMGKWEVTLPRGQSRFEPGHLITVKAAA